MYHIFFVQRSEELKSPVTQKDITYINDLGYDVTTSEYLGIPKNPFKLVRQLKNHLSLIKKCDIIYSSWLTNIYPAILSILSKKPLIMISGGFDTACIPNIGYGAFCNSREKKRVKFVVKHSKIILVTHNSLKSQLEQNIGKKLDNVTELVRGHNPDDWFFDPSQLREGIITIASNKDGNSTRHLVKGIDRFVSLAHFLPEIPFIIIGYSTKSLSVLEKSIPKNMKCIPSMPQKELLEFYQRSKIYCQFSRHEGIPNVVCEAILSGCFPIGSNVNGIPKAISKHGILVDFDDQSFSLQKLADDIKSVYENPIDSQILIENRNQISEDFCYKIRENKLQNIFKRIIAERS